MLCSTWTRHAWPTRSTSDVEIRTLEKDFPASFKVEFMFSSSQNLMNARLGKLRLTQFMEKWKPKERRSLFYLCGPHDYMQMISITLLTEGVPAESIRKEIFDTVKPKIKDLPPDQDPHKVKIRFEGQEYLLTVQYPVTILEEAKRTGVNLPYSCEAGKCGTCSATCTKGNVWMSYNEVLLDKEIEKGRVLTCVGYPAGGDVVLEFPEVE
jgi:ring-1,2-phenylacetyl-CoA epoxidase subunit PaaE